MKFPNLSIVTGLDIETTVATAVAKLARSTVLLFVDTFILDNFTGSTMLILHVKSWASTEIIDLM